MTIQSGDGGAGGDAAELKKQVHQLQLELTSKQQELMELRSKTTAK